MTLRHRDGDEDSSNDFELLESSAEGDSERGIHVPATGVTGEMVEDQIGEAAITAPKIALDAVDETKIRDAAVTQVKIALGAVDTAQLADAAVDTSKLEALAVTATELADASVETTKIANAAVGSAAIASAAVGSAHIETAAITEAKIGTAAVTSAKIADLAVVDAKIDSVKADKLVAGSTITVNLDVTGTLTLNGATAAFRSSTGGRRVAIEDDDALYLYDGTDTSWFRFRTSSASPAGLWMEDAAGNIVGSFDYGAGSSVWANTSAGAFTVNQSGSGDSFRIRRPDGAGGMEPGLEINSDGHFTRPGSDPAITIVGPGDSAPLLLFNMDRDWLFQTRDTASSNKLELHSTTSKEFLITDANRNPVFRVLTSGRIVVEDDFEVNGGNIDLQAGLDGSFLVRDSSDTVKFAVNASDSYPIKHHGHQAPSSDAVYDIGLGSFRYQAIYAQDGTINTSDPAYKTDVTDLPSDGTVLKAVRNLRTVAFKWKDSGTRYHAGILADDLRDTVTKHTSFDDLAAWVDPAVNGEDGPMGIRWHEVGPLLLRAVKDLANEVDDLKSA